MRKTMANPRALKKRAPEGKVVLNMKQAKKKDTMLKKHHPKMVLRGVEPEAKSSEQTERLAREALAALGRSLEKMAHAVGPVGPAMKLADMAVDKVGPSATAADAALSQVICGAKGEVATLNPQTIKAAADAFTDFAQIEGETATVLMSVAEDILPSARAMAQAAQETEKAAASLASVAHAMAESAEGE